MKTELIVALDIEDVNSVKNVVNQLKDEVYAFKIGPQLLLSQGLEILDTVTNLGGKIFLDLKFFDIPSIVKRAVRIILDYNVIMFTLHILGGEKMLREATEFIVTKNDHILPLGVTILTSMDKSEFKNIGFAGDIKTQVLKLAHLAEKSGLEGLVCSPQDLVLLRKEFGNEFKLVTPGIRVKECISDDQSRIATPWEAAKRGADYIVMGRPILNSKDPKRLVKEVRNRL